MPKLEDFKYYGFTVDSRKYVLKATSKYDGIATALGMTPITAPDGVVLPTEGEVLTAEAAVKRGVMVPMICNFRSKTNTKKRGRVGVGIPSDKIPVVEMIPGKSYGEVNVITSVKYSLKRDFR